MEPDIFRFIYRYSKREQIILLAITAVSYPFFYFSLNIPKDIVNHLNAVVKYIQNGQGAERSAIHYPVQELFGIPALNAYSYLFALCGLFLGLVLINGAFKYIINVMSGRTGERLLRRLRYQLYTRMLRFPLPQFRKTSQGELIAMITAEVEPLGGFMGTAVSDPIYQGGLLLVPLIFILVQDPFMGLAAMMLYPAQAYFIPKMQRKVNELGKQRVRTVRKLADRIGEVVTGVHEVHANDTSLIERADFADRVGKIYEIRYRIFLLKFLVKYINNTLDKLTPFFFYALGGYLVFTGQLNIGALVAVIGAHKELAAPWKELLQYYQDKEDARIKYEQVVAQFEPPGMLDDHGIDGEAEKYGLLEGSIIATNVSVIDDSGGTSVSGLDLTVPFDAHLAVVGGAGSGKEEVGLLFARLLQPTSGNLMMGQHRAVDLPESITGRQIAYVGPGSILFNASVRDNIFTASNIDHYAIAVIQVRQHRYGAAMFPKHRCQEIHPVILQPIGSITKRQGCAMLPN
ncbi:MAG: ABC transporter ATP-binding protein [Alphaproteobacteria bacterium]